VRADRVPSLTLVFVGRIRAVLDSSAARGEFSGAVLLARAGRPLLRQAWGMADRGRNMIVAPTTCFNIASLGKILTRAAIAQLLDAGKLSLDVRLSK
jgi:CubicO group peptidase (beta-lactamase class C family)